MNNFLSVLIAVIGIGLLIIGGIKLWSIGYNQEAGNAKSLMNSLEAKINLINDGEKGSVLVQGFEGSNVWYLFGFDSGSQIKPDKCFFKTCLCLCKLDSGSYFDNGMPVTGKINEAGIKVCQSGGICRFFDAKEIEVSTWNTGSNKITIGNLVKGAMAEFEVNKTNGKIIVTDIREKK